MAAPPVVPAVPTATQNTICKDWGWAVVHNLKLLDDNRCGYFIDGFKVALTIEGKERTQNEVQDEVEKLCKDKFNNDEKRLSIDQAMGKRLLQCRRDALQNGTCKALKSEPVRFGAKPSAADTECKGDKKPKNQCLYEADCKMSVNETGRAPAARSYSGAVRCAEVPSTEAGAASTCPGFDACLKSYRTQATQGTVHFQMLEMEPR